MSNEDEEQQQQLQQEKQQQQQQQHEPKKHVRLVASEEMDMEERGREREGEGGDHQDDKGKGKEESLSKSLPGGHSSDLINFSCSASAVLATAPRAMKTPHSGSGSLLLRSPALRSYSRIGRVSPRSGASEDELFLPNEESRLPLHSQSPVITRFANSISVPQLVSVDVQTKRRMRKLLRSLEDMEDRLVNDYDQLPGLREMFEKELQEFAQAYFNYLCTSNDKIIWKSIKPIQPNLHFTSLPPCSFEEEKNALSKSCLLRLNGGKHSSLSTISPECTLEVRPGLTFLDLAVKQASFLAQKYDEQIDLSFLNSFLTHEETVKVLKDYDYHESVDISVFTQSRFPMLTKDSHALVPEDFVGSADKWYPPGTGDVLSSLLSCGVLKEWIKQGKEIIFISNVDNLGAVFEPHIAKYMLDNGIDYLSEVTPYTKNDSHRSFITQYLGAPKVISGKNLPSDEKENFLKQNHAVYTGNCWINLHALLRVIEGGNLKSLDVTANISSYQGKSVIQFERKLASALSLFSNPVLLMVPRCRFVPVRSADDLFLVQSNLYCANEKEGTVSLNSKRPYESLPLIRLGDNFKKFSDYKSRFEGIPSILELDRLTLGGDVKFGSNVTLGGSVIILAKDEGSITIPSGTTLENKIVNGCLNLLQH